MWLRTPEVPLSCGRSRYARAIRRALFIAVAVLALAPASAPAPVPPRDCGFMKVSGAKYNVKADRLRCDPAREYTRAYIKRGARPSGYSCERYDAATTAIAFRCEKGSKEFFAIRR